PSRSGRRSPPRRRPRTPANPPNHHPPEERPERHRRPWPAIDARPDTSNGRRRPRPGSARTSLSTSSLGYPKQMDANLAASRVVVPSRPLFEPSEGREVDYEEVLHRDVDPRRDH